VIEYCAGLIAQIKGKLTELGEDGITPLVQGADHSGNVGVGAAEENIRGDGGGQSHRTTGEDRKDSGETHCSDSEKAENRSWGFERSGMPSRRAEAGDFNAETRPGLYTLSVPPRGHGMVILVAGCPRGRTIPSGIGSQPRWKYTGYPRTRGGLGDVDCLETYTMAAYHPHKTMDDIDTSNKSNRQPAWGTRRQFRLVA